MSDDVLQGNVRVYTTGDYGLTVRTSIEEEVRTRPIFDLMDVKKPYLINRNQIECVVGEWDKEMTTYGVRIFFASGNSVWCGGSAGRKLLEELASSHYGALGERAVKKFDDCASKR